MWQLVIILAELIILVGVVCLAIYLLTKLRKQSVVEIKIKNDTKYEVSEFPNDYSPMPEIFEDEHIKSPLGLYSGVPDEEIIQSRGELIPQNLSDAEKEILRMFYNED